jgi:hypothetical protein
MHPAITQQSDANWEKYKKEYNWRKKYNHMKEYNQK